MASLVALLMGCAGAAACSPGVAGDGPGPGATTSAGEDSSSSSAGSTTVVDPTGATTGTTTGDPPTTGDDATGGPIPCGGVMDCGPGTICIVQYGGDYTGYTCVPNPDGCVPEPACSPACQALCEQYVAGICLGGQPDTHDLACPEFIACNTLNADSGCPDGQKCNPPNYCAPLAPDPIAVGDPCPKQVPDPCVEGAYCMFASSEDSGTCRPLCTGSQDAPVCPDDFVCVHDSDTLVCLPSCDPLVQGCPGEDVCVPGGGAFVCVIDASGDLGKTNDPCEFANACDKGLLCLNPAKASSACMPDIPGCCQPFCDFAAMEPCPNPDQTCLQWFDPMLPIPPGFEDVGVCVIAL